jgi:hypothetical protein
VRLAGRRAHAFFLSKIQDAFVKADTLELWQDYFEQSLTTETIQNMFK